MRKRGARFKSQLKGYLLLPHQIQKYVTPMHMALELLPLGLFTRDHANAIACVVNVIAVDSAGTGNGMWQVADRAGGIISRMYARAKEGKAWNTTAEEREVLRECIVRFDRYLRGWTSARMIRNSATADEIAGKAKVNGGKFLDRVEIPEAA